MSLNVRLRQEQIKMSDWQDQCKVGRRMLGHETRMVIEVVIFVSTQDQETSIRMFLGEEGWWF